MIISKCGVECDIALLDIVLAKLMCLVILSSLLQTRTFPSQKCEPTMLYFFPSFVTWGMDVSHVCTRVDNGVVT